MHAFSDQGVYIQDEYNHIIYRPNTWGGGGGEGEGGISK